MPAFRSRWALALCFVGLGGSLGFAALLMLFIMTLSPDLFSEIAGRHRIAMLLFLLAGAHWIAAGQFVAREWWWEGVLVALLLGLIAGIIGYVLLLPS